MYNKLDKPKDSHFSNGSTNVQLNISIPNKVNKLLGVLSRAIFVFITAVSLPTIAGGLGFIVPKNILIFLLNHEIDNSGMDGVVFISLIIGLFSGLMVSFIVMNELICKDEIVRDYILKGDTDV